MKMIMWALACLLAGSVQAGEVEHQSGEFRFSVGPEPAFVVRHELPDTWDAKAPGADDQLWRYWLYDVQIDNRAGRDVTYGEHAYEAKSQSLIGEAGRFKIEFNPAYQRLTIHHVELRRNGRWQDRLKPERISLARRESGFEQDMADGVVTALIVLDDVRLGDVVRISYSVSGNNPILAGQTADWTRLGWRSPVLDVRMRVLDDPGTKLKFHRENFGSEPVVRESKEGVEASVYAHGMAPVVDEDEYPIWYQPYPLVQISKDRRWSDVIAWALPLYPKVNKLPADLEAKLSEWSKIPDPYQRLGAALRTVQNEVRYFGIEMGENTHRPTAPGDTWQRRYGDCKDKTYLLVTLLERLGLHAAPALVSTVRGRAVADFVPAASVFDHVVVRARVGNQVLWVDPTMTQQGGDPRDSDLSRYGVALPIAEAVTGLEKIVSTRRTKGGIRTTERYAPAADGHNVKLSVETLYRGSSADRARRSIAGERRDDLERRYAEYYRKRYGEVEVVSKPVMLDDLEGNTFKVTEAYLLKSPFENESAAIEAIEVYGEALESVAALPPSISRSGPLDFATPAEYSHEIEIQLPERWRANFDEEALRYASPAFDYKRDIKIGEHAVNLAYRVEIKQPEVMPDTVPSHLGELRKMRDSLSARLRFQIPSGLQSQQREERLKALLKNVMDEGAH